MILYKQHYSSPDNITKMHAFVAYVVIIIVIVMLFGKRLQERQKPLQAWPVRRARFNIIYIRIKY